MAFRVSGGGFATGRINLGGLEVCECTTFSKIWSSLEGGPDNLGASFYKPSPLPAGFSLLGYYGQPNNRPLYGWVLLGKDLDGGALCKPKGYSLLWSSESSKTRRNGDGYFWQPIPPDSYRAVGILVTSSSEIPSLEEISCVRVDLTEQSEDDEWLWGTPDGLHVYSQRPVVRGSSAAAVSVGTCVAAPPEGKWCLKNAEPLFWSAPCLMQIEALVNAYSPWICLHPDEPYFPSSVGWFFEQGAMLHKKGGAAEPVDLYGKNLPQGGVNDGEYWIDLPIDESAKNKVKIGNLASSEISVHVKPVLGGTATDMAFWVFYPFNGPGRAKLGVLTVPFKRVGEHVGDWEHVTVRVSNFSGELKRVYFAAHSAGQWKHSSEVEFLGGNKPVGYVSLHGHATYAKPGMVLIGGSAGVGIKDDTARGGLKLDAGSKWLLVAADHLRSPVGPAWLNFMGEWGPKISYDFAQEIRSVGRLLPDKLRRRLENLLKSLPPEILGEEGPTGPKEKRNWAGDEV